MKRNIAILLILIMAVSVMFTGCNTGSQKTSTSDDSWKSIQTKGEFVLGMDEAFPPMGFRDENNNLVGFDVDVAKEVCERLGLTLKLQPINWSAKEHELNTKNIDAIWNGFTITDARKKEVLFTEPYMNNRQVLVVMANSAYRKLSDLEGKKLALQAGSSAADALDSSPDFKSKLKEIAELDDNMMALMDLERGGVDVVLMDEIVANYYITVGGKDYKVLDEELAREEFGVGFRKDDKQLMAKFQTTLEEMAKDGTLAKISTDWFGKDVTTIGK